MHIRLGRPVAVMLALLALLAAACGGGGDDAAEVAEPADPRNDFAARVLQLGEPLDTVIDSRDGELVAGLQAILNPEAVNIVDNAVTDGGDALALIAETAGMTAAEFTAAWEADQGDAFARFASALRDAEDPAAVRDELFLPTIASLPVHPDAVLVASARIDNPDGSQRYFLAFDLVGSTMEVEETLSSQLDQSPWQVTGGQSSEEIAIVQFQSTMSADIQGIAWAQPVLSSATLEAAAAEAAGAGASGSEDEATDEASPPIEGPLASLLYLVQKLPSVTAEDEDFELPRERPLPRDFPAGFLIDEQMTVAATAWSRQPGGTAYRITVLAAGSSFDLAESYRERIEAEGWELTGDDAVGFATVLAFAADSDGIQGEVELDAFPEDEGYTQVVITVQLTSGSPTE